MTIDFCNLCGDPCTGKNAWIGNNNSQETWRTLVAQALCALATNSPDVVAATQLPQVAKTAAQLTASYGSYADLGLLNTTAKLRRFTIQNNTDADIEISLDAGVTTHFRVLATSVRNIDLGNYTFAAQTDLRIRRATGMTAGTGVAYFEGGY